MTTENETTRPADAGPLERQVRRLGWWARMRVNAIDVELAGLRAKLSATQGAIRMVAEGSSIPGSLVYDMRDLPRQIAELEERRRQTLTPNDGDQPRP
ncbi:MAG: hypothetical protein ABMA00_08965 [Gemmatimonas sp.]